MESQIDIGQLKVLVFKIGLLIVNLIFIFKSIEMARKKRRLDFWWFILSVCFSLITYVVLSVLDTKDRKLKKKTYVDEQDIIPIEDIDKVYYIEKGEIIIGDGKVLLNGAIALDGTYHIKRRLKVLVKESKLKGIVVFGIPLMK